MPPLSAAAASGDRRATLEALRAVLAASIEASDPEKVAPLAKQLRDTLAELETLPRKEQSTSDDLAARRKARRSTAKDRAPAAGGSVE